MSDSKDEIVLKLLQKISDKQEQTQESVVEIDRKVELHIQKMEYELDRINRLDDKQNQLLDEHIAGVQTLKAMYEAHEKSDMQREALFFQKLQELDEPRRWIKTTIKVILGTSAVIAALTTIYKFLI